MGKWVQARNLVCGLRTGTIALVMDNDYWTDMLEDLCPCVPTES